LGTLGSDRVYLHPKMTAMGQLGLQTRCQNRL
jgi:hypothetical protein